MLNHVPRLALLKLLLLSFGYAQAQELWVSSEHYGAFHVLVAGTASQSEQLAAKEFKAYWAKTTGHDIKVSDTPSAEGPNVWIGRDGLPQQLLRSLDLEGLGTDGLVIRTFPASETSGPQLVIVGGRERGTMYGVYEFFERYMGVRWITPELTHIPEAPPESIPEIDYRFVPPFLRRSGFSYYGYERGPARDFMRIQRLSGYPQFGGPFVHSSFILLPPEKYFAEHPEFYSEIDGERRAPVGIANYLDPAVMARHPDKVSQLCYSNPDVAAALVAVLEPMMRAQPDKRIWSVSQNDYGGNCKCAECNAIDEREGTPMGSLLTGINRVADAIKDEFPNNYIDTLAYTYTRRPPKHIRPRDNVIISLCNIECDMARPMTDRKSRINRAFAKDIKGWAKIAPNLYFWDYPDTAYNVLTPFPNFHTMQANMRFWKKHGFKGAFLCGSGGTPVGLGALRGYLLCKLVWDPDCDLESHRRDFMTLYYGEAAPYLEQYIDVLTRGVLESGKPMPCLDPPRWLGYDTVVAAMRVLDEARAAAKSKAVRARIEATQVQMQYAALVCVPKVTQMADKFVLERPPSPTLDEFLGIIAQYPGHAMQHWSVPTEMIKAEAGGRTPPRYEEADIIRLENEHAEIWVCPGIAGAVLRWVDKKTGRELLEGHERFTEGRSMIHEWDMTPVPKSYPYFPIAPEYAVLERDRGRLALRAHIGGFDVTRRMVLDEDPGGLAIEIDVQNATDAPLDPRVKLHTEFWTQGPKAAEFWIQDEAGWRIAKLDDVVVEDIVWLKAFSPSRIRRWAYHAPGRRLTLVNSFDPGELGKLIGLVNTQYEHVIMDLEPRPEPFAPGETRTIHSRYEVTTKRPNRL